MEDIKVRKFENDDIIKVKKFFGDAVRQTPPIIGSEISEPLMQLCEDEVLATVSQGFSVVAEDTTNGELVGFFINKGMKAEDFLKEEDMEDFDDTLLITFMELKCDAFQKSNLLEKYPDAKKLLNLDLLHVKDGYKGKGIAKLLVEGSLEVAKANGFDCAFTVATSHYTYRVVMKLGFEELYKLRYDEWKREDGTPASEVFKLEEQGVHQECVLCCKVLNE